jgi:uncharacterized protein YlaI
MEPITFEELDEKFTTEYYCPNCDFSMSHHQVGGEYYAIHPTNTFYCSECKVRLVEDED